MCALCGVLGGTGHWTDPVHRPGLYAAASDPAERRRGRTLRLAAARRVLDHYRLSLADWQGSAFVLSTATGKSEVIDDLGHLWPAAERLLGRACDPLDPDLVARLEASSEGRGD